MTPKDLVESVEGLTSFPDIAFRINDLLADDSSGIADIAKVVETDPALTSALLRLANSALFSLGGTVSNIDRAIAVVGMREVRSLAYSTSARATFKGIPFELFSVENFWRHSLYVGVAAQNIALATGIRTGESFFTAGLLHDIGQPVLFANQPELSKQALELSLQDNDGLTPHVSEHEIFGFDHAAVGAELARKWCFPSSLIDCIEHHHKPYDAENLISESALIVYLANSVATLAELDSDNLYDAPPIDERTFTDLNISPDMMSKLVKGTQEGSEDLLKIFIN